MLHLCYKERTQLNKIQTNQRYDMREISLGKYNSKCIDIKSSLPSRVNQ